MPMIFDLIVQAKARNADATMELIKQFNPLLKKYAYKLFYEDAYNDLVVDLIEIIQNIRLERVYSRDEGSLIAYISTSVYNSYLERVKYKKFYDQVGLNSQLSDSEHYFVEIALSTTDTYFSNELPDLQKYLTITEETVIDMLYFKGYTVKEIARHFGITRQAVNQMKKRALEKLRIVYLDKC
jgi:RNA polymerase sigma factor (sigma-70 family)